VAEVTVKLPNEYLRKLSRLGKQADEICARMLEAGGKVVEDKIRSNLQAVIGSGTQEPSRSTGELLESLGTSEVKQDADGILNVKVGFAEPRSDGGSNAKIANIIEYGKHGQPPKPFLKPAKTATRDSCAAAMRQVFDEEVGKL
jgi:HK97 gp10 family phage protein